MLLYSDYYPAGWSWVLDFFWQMVGPTLTEPSFNLAIKRLRQITLRWSSTDWRIIKSIKLRRWLKGNSVCLGKIIDLMLSERPITSNWLKTLQKVSHIGKKIKVCLEKNGWGSNAQIANWQLFTTMSCSFSIFILQDPSACPLRQTWKEVQGEDPCPLQCKTQKHTRNCSK